MEPAVVIQITPQMKVLVAVEPVDFRNGIDGLAARCRAVLGCDPFSGTAFVFRNRRATAVKVLIYDTQGFWLCLKRLSAGRFRFWPTSSGERGRAMLAHELQVLLWGGDPEATRAAPPWRSVSLVG
jgi:transposase